MQMFSTRSAALAALLGGMAVMGLVLSVPLAGNAQDKADPNVKHQHPDQKDQAKDLADQVRDLQAKIARLEAALKQGHKGTPPAAPDAGGMGGMPMGMMGGQKSGMGMMGMGGMEGMKPDQMMDQMMQNMGQMMQMMGQMQGKGMGGGMGMMDMMKGGMGSGKKGMGGMGMEDDMEMMGMMGKAGLGQDTMKGMKGMGTIQKTATLPGFPGASHIYHIGATGFFLDHPEHVMLTTKQQAALNAVKERALLEKSTSQRKIDEAEQELWTLTASDQPDATKIDAKVREIEKLRGDQRLAFVRAVGEAAKVLTDEQRQALLGTGTGKPDPHAGHNP
jgi:Spy/CpxP family protein refolding chaperone